MYTIEHYLRDGKRLAQKGSAVEITAALLRARQTGSSTPRMTTKTRKPRNCARKPTL